MNELRENQMDETCLKDIPQTWRNRMYAQLRVTLVSVVGAVLCLTTSASAQTVQSQAQSPTTPLAPSVVAPPASSARNAQTAALRTNLLLIPRRDRPNINTLLTNFAP